MFRVNFGSIWITHGCMNTSSSNALPIPNLSHIASCNGSYPAHPTSSGRSARQSKVRSLGEPPPKAEHMTIRQSPRLATNLWVRGVGNTQVQRAAHGRGTVRASCPHTRARTRACARTHTHTHPHTHTCDRPHQRDSTGPWHQRET